MAFTLKFLALMLSFVNVNANGIDSIYNMLEETGNHGYFLKLVNSVSLTVANSSLTDLLKGAAMPPECNNEACQITLFAPTDAALQISMKNVGVSVDSLDAMDHTTTGFLVMYHMLNVNGGTPMTLADMVHGSLDTAAKLSPSAPFAKISLSPAQAGNGWQVTDQAGVTQPLATTELRASNGVVHSLDKSALLPINKELLQKMSLSGIGSTETHRRQMLMGDAFNGTTYEYLLSPNDGYSYFTTLLSTMAGDPNAEQLIALLQNENANAALFLPSDAAVLSLATASQEGSMLLTSLGAAPDIFLYHLRLGGVPNVSVGESMPWEMLSGEEVTLENSGSHPRLPFDTIRTFMGQTIRMVDFMQTNNGVVMKVSAVLRGSNFLSSLNEELKGSEDHSVLYSVVEQAGMGHLLVGKPFVREGPAWLLAPTNAAFQNFFQDMGLDMQMMMGPPMHPYLVELVEYHVWLSNENSTAQAGIMEMMNGETVTLYQNSTWGYDIITDVSGNTQWLYESNTTACRNGHLISVSRVLVPSKPASYFTFAPTTAPTYTSAASVDIQSVFPRAVFDLEADELSALLQEFRENVAGQIDGVYPGNVEITLTPGTQPNTTIVNTVIAFNTEVEGKLYRDYIQTEGAALLAVDFVETKLQNTNPSITNVTSTGIMDIEATTKVPAPPSENHVASVWTPFCVSAVTLGTALTALAGFF
mmetsp:Transcript_44304/g.84711  ORF Transcript_44304/g.84711 Transcript_44304/m.84711 type:complete len:702 (+) Transcript_44304:82-2187(+)|eukprot:CAMPEP_0114245792 /NCGR_PEP_ID=MMETSP0058-20121206/12099_1 /TAXON_ID=36894 /ORGANISM="Pyramimonas parkeae, CCMP726" /LENGTH=701 /DNA_ID=CAMNT_0001358897 /DNA_START=76 /DNA_END=2181 /DNA_ORIENTATION=-